MRTPVALPPSSGTERIAPCSGVNSSRLFPSRTVSRHSQPSYAPEPICCFSVNPGTASIVLAAKGGGGKSGVLILGGGSPKNFMLQTEPQIQEVLGIDERGHDYFLQITDARPDTGGLSGATPAEAVSWGKIDPDKLPDAVVCYADSTIALPLLTSYALAKRDPRPLKRLFDRRQQINKMIKGELMTRGNSNQ